MAHSHTGEKAMWKPEAETGVMHLQTQESQGLPVTQEPEEARKDPSWSLWVGGCMSLLQHLGFRLLDSRTVKE